MVSTSHVEMIGMAVCNQIRVNRVISYALVHATSGFLSIATVEIDAVRACGM